MKAVSMYQNHIPFIFNGNAHFFKTGDGRKTVGALKKAVDSVVPFAREPNITARWEMDLSPGTVISRGPFDVTFQIC